MPTHTKTLHIDGMSCQHCVRAVREAIEAIPGVELEDVEIGSAIVRLDSPDETVREALRQAVDDAGYTVSPRGPW
ncbi:MAG: heavy-metal-associated domain-containing protein [Rhodothermaceae bacterium]|nr:heavy-metal-associated domain-containing protein [Rhodothermaceae bacterium]